MSKEHREELKTNKVYIECYICGGKEVHSIGNVLTSYPPQYVHKCMTCFANITLDKSYPYIEHVLANPKIEESNDDPGEYGG